MDKCVQFSSSSRGDNLKFIQFSQRVEFTSLIGLLSDYRGMPFDCICSESSMDLTVKQINSTTHVECPFILSRSMRIWSVHHLNTLLDKLRVNY